MLRNTVKALSRLNNMNFHLFTHLSLQAMPQVSRAPQTKKRVFTQKQHLPCKCKKSRQLV